MIALFNRFQIEMTLREAIAMSPRGRNADGIVALFVKQTRFQNQLNKIGAGNIQLELKEYGSWDDDELADVEANKQRILWIAACNIREENDRAGK